MTNLNTKMTDLDVLQNQINCRNMVNSQSEKVRAELDKVFSEFLGKKIVKFSPGKSLSAAVEKKIKYISDGLHNCGFTFYFSVSISSVYANVKRSYKTSEMSCGYCSNDFFVASFDAHGVMKPEARNFCKMRDDYTVQEILDARENIKRLESELAAAKFAIREFR
jgi:hypothetical protein